eukprot:COSAG03_NODE_9763_length_695_cov_0.865772_1_plen_86_part_00
MCRPAVHPCRPRRPQSSASLLPVLLALALALALVLVLAPTLLLPLALSLLLHPRSLLVSCVSLCLCRKAAQLALARGRLSAKALH